MLSSGALAFLTVSILILLASGYWTDRRYSHFDQLPGHYDIRGEPTRMTSRRVMAWLLPAIFSLSLIGFVVLVEVVPPEMQNGDPDTGLIVAAVSFLGAQALVLWLLHRWAARQ